MDDVDGDLRRSSRLWRVGMGPELLGPHSQCKNLWLNLPPRNRDRDGAHCLLCVVFPVE